MVAAANIHHAKTHLSRLLIAVGGGDEVVIAKNGTPLARLISIVDAQFRKPGRFRGQITGADSLLKPLSRKELANSERGHPNDPFEYAL